MKQELSKAKKTLREKEKELIKLRQEVSVTKKAVIAGALVQPTG